MRSTLLLLALAIGCVHCQVPVLEDYYGDLTEWANNNPDTAFSTAGNKDPARVKLAQKPPAKAQAARQSSSPQQQSWSGSERGTPNDPGAGAPCTVDCPKSQGEINCESITCNFEAGTMCLWSIGGEPAYDREGRLQAKIDAEDAHAEWKARLEALSKPGAVRRHKRQLPSLGGLGGGGLPSLGGSGGEDLPTKMIRLGKLVDHWLKEPKKPTYGTPRKGWVSARGKLGNTASGVKTPFEGSSFAGAYLFPGEYAIMTVPVKIQNPAGVQVVFSAYDDADGIQLKVCCDDETYCGFQSPVASLFEQGWQKHQHVYCPQGTEQIVVVCTNEDQTLEGACGIDDIKMDDELPPQCRQRFTKGPYVNEFLARIGGAEDLNATPSPAKRQELIKKILAAGDKVLNGGDLSSVLDDAAASRARLARRN